MNIKTLILTGEGINCEVETAHVFQLAGSETQIMHVDDFLELSNFTPYDIIAFPGGFSYADEIRSGKILAEKINFHQKENITKFIEDKKPIIGICNGFQILTQLGVFSSSHKHRLTLAENSSGKFTNRWVELNITNSPCLWLKNLKESLFMPIRHKEGCLVGEIPKELVALKYTRDINGSFENIAALTNHHGNVLGLMPHPEAAAHPFLFPEKGEKSISNLQIFKNAVEYAKGMKE